MTAIGSLGSAHQADVDERGAIAPIDRPWSLDWWVGADDRWHIPAREPAVRQSLVESVPVVRTAMRVAGGDAVQHAYGVASPAGTVVVEFTNESPLPFVVALVVRDARRADLDGARLDVDGVPALRLPRPPSRWAATTDATTETLVAAGHAHDDPFESPADRTGHLEVACLYPLAHRARLRVAVTLRKPRRVAAVDLDALPSPGAAARGWRAQLERGMQVEVPDAGLDAAVRAARAAVLLAGARRTVEPSVVAALEDWGFDAEASTAWSRLGWRSRRTASRRPPNPGGWSEVTAAVPAGGAELLLAVRALLAHEADDATITLLADLPPAWRGQSLEVHAVPTRHGLLSYAVRWHGARPALLWDAPAGVRLRAPGLDPSWVTGEPARRRAARGGGRVMDPQELERLGVYDPAAPDAAERLTLVHLALDHGAPIEEIRLAIDGSRLHALAAERLMLDRPPSLTLGEVAAKAEVAPELAARLWRALGFALAAPDAAVCTDGDVDVLAFYRDVAVTAGPDAAISLARGSARRWPGPPTPASRSCGPGSKRRSAAPGAATSTSLGSSST